MGTVECSLALRGGRQLDWCVLRRLKRLREELHDAVKAELGHSYVQIFDGKPFAKRGGLRGTTALLDGWCKVLAACINDSNCVPRVVALALRFLEVPEPPAVPGSVQAVSHALPIMRGMPQAWAGGDIVHEDEVASDEASLEEETIEQKEAWACPETVDGGTKGFDAATVDAGQVADTQAKDPFLLVQSTLVDKATNGRVHGAMHCNQTAEKPAMTEVQLRLRMDEKELAPSQEVSGPDEVGEAAEALAAAGGDLSTAQPEPREEECANEPDSQGVAPTEQDPAGLVVTCYTSTTDPQDQQEERTREPHSQSIVPAQEVLVSADVCGIDGSLTAPKGSVLAEMQVKYDGVADKTAAPGGG